MPTNKPARVMIDANVHQFVREDIDVLRAISESNTEVFISGMQIGEITNGLDDASPERQQQVREQLNQFEKAVKPKDTNIDTSGYGEAYGYNYGGSTGEIYEKLMKHDDSIAQPDRADAIGAEAAINRNLPFVTHDIPLIEKMRKVGYESYVIPWEEFKPAYVDVK